MRLAAKHKSARGNNGSGRNNEFVRGRVVGQDAAGNVNAARAVVVKLDVVVIGRIGVREKLVDDHVAQRARCK
jgi:hypothetical protein